MTFPLARQAPFLGRPDLQLPIINTITITMTMTMTTTTTTLIITTTISSLLLLLSIIWSVFASTFFGATRSPAQNKVHSRSTWTKQLETSEPTSIRGKTQECRPPFSKTPFRSLRFPPLSSGAPWSVCLLDQVEAVEVRMENGSPPSGNLLRSRLD